MSDYSEQITIPSSTQVTIEGSSQTSTQSFFADASGKGRFFEVESGGTLVLNSLTLKNGHSDNVSQQQNQTITSGELSRTCYVPPPPF